MTMQPMTIEIWSDVACPWCYIGKRRFEKALSSFSHSDDVQVIWRSFQLEPDAPPTSSENVYDMLSRKYHVSRDQAVAMNNRVASVAATEGLDFQLDRINCGNTFDAHRLIHLAAAHDMQEKAKERLLHAYFVEGLAVGDHDTLAAIASELGLPNDEVQRMLEGDDYAGDVRADLRRGAAFGIQGVPFFVIDERYGISGAQPAEVFLDALRRVWSESHPLTIVGSAESGPDNGTASCDADGCRIHAS
jgi:predicted DsbA family dithiol-disulfide isomerase